MTVLISGIRVVGKGSWKEREVGKFLFKLERAKRSWKTPSEVGRNRTQLESFCGSWKVSAEVGKFPFSLKVLAVVRKINRTWKVITEVGKCHCT